MAEVTAEILGVWPLSGDRFVEVYKCTNYDYVPWPSPTALLYKIIKIDEEGRHVLSESYSQWTAHARGLKD